MALTGVPNFTFEEIENLIKKFDVLNIVGLLPGLEMEFQSLVAVKPEKLQILYKVLKLGENFQELEKHNDDIGSLVGLFDLFLVRGVSYIHCDNSAALIQASNSILAELFPKINISEKNKSEQFKKLKKDYIVIFNKLREINKELICLAENNEALKEHEDVCASFFLEFTLIEPSPESSSKPPPLPPRPVRQAAQKPSQSSAGQFIVTENIIQQAKNCLKPLPKDEIRKELIASVSILAKQVKVKFFPEDLTNEQIKSKEQELRAELLNPIANLLVEIREKVKEKEKRTMQTQQFQMHLNRSLQPRDDEKALQNKPLEPLEDYEEITPPRPQSP